MDRNFFQNYRAEQIARVAGTYTVKPYEQLVLLTNGAFTVTLPKLSESVGRLFVFVQDSTGTSNITIADAGDDTLFTDQVINAQAEQVAVFNTGFCWSVFHGQTS
jgi:hypothetical protein